VTPQRLDVEITAAASQREHGIVRRLYLEAGGEGRVRQERRQRKWRLEDDVIVGDEAGERRRCPLPRGVLHHEQAVPQGDREMLPVSWIRPRSSIELDRHPTVFDA
jgi:hypothetical protein